MIDAILNWTSAGDIGAFSGTSKVRNEIRSAKIRDARTIAWIRESLELPIEPTPGGTFCPVQILTDDTLHPCRQFLIHDLS